jgi:pimeloyl-ACP methyl ester carboxylesterase
MVSIRRCLTGTVLVSALLLMQSGCADVTRARIFRPAAAGEGLAAFNGNAPREVSVKTVDGLTLTGLRWEDGTKDVVLVFHGNAGNHFLTALALQGLRDQGYDVIIAGFRGYGGNPGTPTERALASDAKAWFSFAQSQRDPSHIIIVGFSLGTNLALRAAGQTPVKGFILFSPFTNLPALAPRVVRFSIVDRFDNVAAARCVQGPIAAFWGTSDRLVKESIFDDFVRQAPSLILQRKVDEKHQFNSASFLKSFVEAEDYLNANPIARPPTLLAKAKMC